MTAVARLARPLLLIVPLVAVGLLLRPMLPHDLAGAARHGGRGWFVALGAASCAIALPRQAVAFAGGLAFGVGQGGLLAMAAQLLGCAADFCFARVAAPGWVARLLAAPRFARVRRLLAAHPFVATLTFRLLPVGNSAMLSLAAGSAGVPAVPFLAGTALGYVPQTLVFVLLGSGTRVGRAAELAVGVGCLVLSSALGWVLWRRSATDAG